MVDKDLQIDKIGIEKYPIRFINKDPKVNLLKKL